MKIASYKGTRPGLQALFSIGVRTWLSGRYSHSELVFGDGMCGSCSYLDGGVRLKRITLTADHWDVAHVAGDEAAARQWFEARAGERYSLWLLASFVVKPLATWASGKGHVCSTAIAAALGVGEPWRIDPCVLPHVAAT